MRRVGGAGRGIRGTRQCASGTSANERGGLAIEAVPGQQLASFQLDQLGIVNQVDLVDEYHEARDSDLASQRGNGTGRGNEDGETDGETGQVQFV